VTFSFLRDRDATSNDEPLASIAALAMSGLPPLNDVLAEMLDVLKTHFPANPALSLETRVSIVSVSEQSLGLGNRRGQAQRSGFPVVALKGGRLDAVVRFQAIANDPEVVETAIDDLHASLLAAKDALWVAGFLRVVAQDSSSAELIAGPDTWR